MKTPNTEELADVVRDCVETYVRANYGSDEHPLGKAELGTIGDFIPHLKEVPSVKGGFAIRFPDGTLYLLNVHQMPGTVPLNAQSESPPQEPSASGT